MPKHNHTASIVKEVLVHALFWIVVTLRFLNTSFLRPQNSLSIELTCLIILIGLVYVNMLVWVPQLWKKDKRVLYLLLFLFSTIGSAMVEVFLCKNNIKENILPFTNLHTYYCYLYDIFISVSLRNGCFLMFSALYKLFKINRQAVREGEAYISQQIQKIVILDADGGHEIPLEEIAYLQVSKRSISIFTDSGTFYQDRTFSDFEQLLPKNSFVRISRQLVILLTHVVAYTPKKVYMSHGGKIISFTYSNSPSFEVLPKLQQWNPALFKEEDGD